jgi:pimeloyl-ACP methyl ester carboxylesterase
VTKAKKVRQIASTLGASTTASKSYRCGVVTVHGVRTTGKWQKELAPILQDNLIFGVHVDYDYSRPTVTARGISERAANDFAAKCEQVVSQGLKVHAVGHSFGTLVVGRALDLKPELRLHRLVLSSSILSHRFEWTRIHKQKRIRKVLNEFCPKDYVVPWGVLYRLLWLPTGRSGTKGFSDTCDGVVANVSYREVGHTRLPTSDHMTKAWIPFFLRGQIPSGN